MWPMVILSMLITTATIFTLQSAADGQELNKTALDQTNVMSFAVYRKAVVDYSADHPSVIGEISDADLAPYFTYGYVHPGLWRNVITTDSLYVFTDYQLNTEMLNKRFYRSLLVGKNMSGHLVSLGGQNTLITLPSQIPANAIVIAGR